MVYGAGLSRKMLLLLAYNTMNSINFNGKLPSQRLLEAAGDSSTAIFLMKIRVMMESTCRLCHVTIPIDTENTSRSV